MIRQQAEFACASHDAHRSEGTFNIRLALHVAIEERAATQVRALAHRVGVTAVARALEQLQTIDA